MGYDSNIEIKDTIKALKLCFIALAVGFVSTAPAAGDFDWKNAAWNHNLKYELGVEQPGAAGESKFRRGEVLFFISLPFTLLYTYGLVTAGKSLAGKNPTTPEKMDWAFVSGGSVMFSLWVSLYRRKPGRISDLSAFQTRPGFRL